MLIHTRRSKLCVLEHEAKKGSEGSSTDGLPLLTHLKMMGGKCEHNFQINFPADLKGASNFIPSPLDFMERHMTLLSLTIRTRLLRQMMQEAIMCTAIASTAWKRSHGGLN